MGVFGAFFGCIGDGGFNGRCLGASIGDGGFVLAYISACRGVIGFKVGTWLCPGACSIVCVSVFCLKGLMHDE